MNEQNNPLYSSMDDREDLIFRYIEAVDSGDETAQDQLLTQAMRLVEDGDLLLESTLWEIQLAAGNELMQADAAAAVAAQTADAARVLAAAQTGFSTPVAATRAELLAQIAAQNEADELASEAEPPPLTLRDVAARLRTDLNRLPARLTPLMRDLITRLEARSASEPLDESYLTRRGARTFLEHLGVGEAASWLEKQFHQSLFSLEASRRQEVHLAAARRRSRRSHSAPPPPAPLPPGTDEQKDTPS